MTNAILLVHLRFLIAESCEYNMLDLIWGMDLYCINWHCVSPSAIDLFFLALRVILFAYDLVCWGYPRLL